MKYQYRFGGTGNEEESQHDLLKLHKEIILFHCIVSFGTEMNNLFEQEQGGQLSS